MADPNDGTTRRDIIVGIGRTAVLAQPLVSADRRTQTADIDHPRSVNETLSVMDFMTPAQVQNVRSRLGTVDCTAAFNAAFEYARIAGRTVYMPDGVYLVGNLVFGSQNEKGQSLAPFGLIGQSKTGSILKAKPGLTGTLLRSWSIAGVTFRDFAIDTTGSHAVAWDCSWRAGVGPSTQCVIEHILITVHDEFRDGATAHVNWNDLNDTYPLGVSVRPGATPSYTNCYISMVQSGGLSAMASCIWAGGFLRFGCQNGELSHCWGMGIEFAFGALNHVRIAAGYMYANPVKKTIFWSQSNRPNTGLKSLTIVATEMNTQAARGMLSYFDINLFSMLAIDGSEFIGTAPALFGTAARGDGVGPALCRITGGTYYTQMALDDCPNGSRIEVECSGLRNAQTGEMANKGRTGTFAPDIRGNGVVGQFKRGPATFGRYHRSGNIVYFKLRVDWTMHMAAGAHVAALIDGLPLQLEDQGVEGVTLEAADGNFEGARAMISGGTIRFYRNDGSPVLLAATGSVTLSGFYTVKA